MPDGANSPAIANYRAKVEGSGAELRVVAGWSPEPKGIAQSIAGTASQPPRDPRGLRPDGQAKVAQALADFAQGLATGKAKP